MTVNPEERSLMGLQEIKQREGNPYDILPWYWLVVGIVVATVMGIIIGYGMVRVVGW